MKIVYIFLLSVLVLSCNNDEATLSKESISENDVLGSWKVTYLEHADVSELSTYVFEFTPNNELVITKGGIGTSGTWEIMEDLKSIKILIPKKEYPLRTLHGIWGVNSASSQILKLSEMESEHEFLETSHFTRL